MPVFAGLLGLLSQVDVMRLMHTKESSDTYLKPNLQSMNLQGTFNPGVLYQTPKDGHS
jgi:hypothetical protein